MTAVQAGTVDGLLMETAGESGLDTDDPQIRYSTRRGPINADLTVGADLSRTHPLKATDGLAWNGVMLAARGFVVSASERDHIASSDEGRSAAVMRPFLNGADLVRVPRVRFVIDFFGMDDTTARAQGPSAYQHLLATVKPERDKARDAAFREKWWLFGRPRPDLRTAIQGQTRFIGSTETSKHRLFQFIDSRVLPDHMIVSIAIDDASILATLSSRHHVAWATASGGWLGIGNDPRYSKSRCFDPFPFPAPPEDLKARLSALGEELDATRKRVQAEHPDLTLTGLYNVLEKLKAQAPLTPADEDVKQRGLVLILKELHEHIDALTADAYGWPRDLTDEQILERLVALNAERAKEEAAGHVRWLRPDYQIPRFARGAAAKSGELDLGESVVVLDKGLPVFPKDRYEQPLAVEAALMAAGRPMDAAELARGFKGKAKGTEQRIVQVLTTLARYGRVTALPRGRYAARKAA